MKRFLFVFFLIILTIPNFCFAETVKEIKDKDDNVIGTFHFPDEWSIEEEKYVFTVKKGVEEIGFISINPYNTLDKEKQMQMELAAEDQYEFHEQMKVSKNGIKYYYYTLTDPLNPDYLAEKYVADLDVAIISFNISQGKNNHYALDFIGMIDTKHTVPQDYTEEIKDTKPAVKEEPEEVKLTFMQRVHQWILDFFRPHV